MEVLVRTRRQDHKGVPVLKCLCHRDFSGANRLETGPVVAVLPFGTVVAPVLPLVDLRGLVEDLAGTFTLAGF